MSTDPLGQALLTINHHQRLLLHHIAMTFDINNRTDEMRLHAFITARAHQVIPQLMALGRSPGVITLVERNHKLRRLAQEIE